MRRLLVVGALLCAMGLIGCSGGSKETPTAANAAAQGPNSSPEGSQAAAREPIAVPATATPEQVMAVFLDALKAGDQATTASLLTKKALDETTKRSLSVCPEATPHMQYQISQAGILPDNPNGAHVAVRWTEKYQDGDVSYDVTWVLRKQPVGWRVAGMAMELIPGSGQEFLNFEDPDDMLRKQEAALAAMSPPAAETAAVPASATEPASTTPPASASEPAGASGVDFAPSEAPAAAAPNRFTPSEEPAPSREF